VVSLVCCVFHILKLTSPRDFTVNNYWPRQSVTIPAIKGMYEKMLKSERGPSSMTQPSNGQSNGS
jgi:chromodomain-helicase-DNA-binding protein 1